MNRWRKNFLILIGVAAGIALTPLSYGESFLALTRNLNRQVALLEAVQPYVERPDLPRILVLKETAKRVLQTIKEQGPANTLTIQSLQELVISYRFSKDLFSSVRTAVTTDQIKEIQELTQTIAKQSGFDSSPFTRITSSVYKQQYELIKKLLELGIPDELSRQLSSLKPDLGRLLAIAEQGDQAQYTQELASKLARKIETLYPAFNEISASHAAFYTVIEIQGLNEFYIDFTRMSEASPARGGGA